MLNIKEKIADLEKLYIKENIEKNKIKYLNIEFFISKYIYKTRDAITVPPIFGLMKK
jgi:hypothetical protein